MKFAPVSDLRASLLAGLVLIGLLLPLSARAETLTLADIMKKAQENHDSVKAQKYEIDARDADQKSMRGHFFPVVMAKFNLVVWDEEQKVSLDMGSLTSMMEATGSVFTDLVAYNMANPGFLSDTTVKQLMALAAAQADSDGDSSILMREQVTYTFTISIGQPLTGLYTVYSGYRATGAMKAAAEQEMIRLRYRLQADVSKAYFSLLSARTMTQTAQAALKQIEAIEAQVKAYLENGLVEKNALMKVQVQKAEITKLIFNTEKITRLLTASLNIYMGQPLDTPLAVEETPPATNPDALLSQPLADQQEKAVSRRPELRGARQQGEAAHWAKHASIGEFIPQVNLFFQYDNNQGMGSMSKESQYYGGLTLSWNVWEWGASWYKMRAAQHREDQVRYMIAQGENGVRLEVESKRLDLEEAVKTLEVARVQQEQAHENLRVEQARYDAQETTTSDLLSAQTQQLKADNDVTVAELSVRAAVYALRSAMGEDLTGQKEK